VSVLTYYFIVRSYCCCRDGLTSAVELIPKLWPFLQHSIRSVRRATLRTLSMLLAKGKLKVSEPVSIFLIKHHLFEELLASLPGIR